MTQRSGNSRRCVCEALELRQLLNASFARLTSHDTIVVKGTGGNDNIVISSQGDQVAVTMNGQTEAFSALTAKRLRIDAGAGDDTVLVQVQMPSTILGSDGNDTITGGPGDDRINGGAGDDFLSGGAGNDTINGETGNDSLTGGDGTDTADYSDRTTGFQFLTSGEGSGSATSGTEIDTFSDICEDLIGTDQADSFRRAQYANDMILDGRGGDDSFTIFSYFYYYQQRTTVFGGAGDDEVTDYGEGFELTFFGGRGDDTFNETQDDELPIFYGGPGIDQIIESSPVLVKLDMRPMKGVEIGTIVNGVLIGNDGPNVLTSEGAFATISGMGGNDLLISNSEVQGYYDNVLNGGDGNDTLVGSGYASYVYGIEMNGDAGNDHIYGTAYPDTITGGDGKDQIFGGDADDRIDGGSGNDRIYGGAGDDTIIGGPGRDRLNGDDGDDLILARDGFRDRLYGGSGANAATVDDSCGVRDRVDEIQTFM